MFAKIRGVGRKIVTVEMEMEGWVGSLRGVLVIGRIGFDDDVHDDDM